MKKMRHIALSIVLAVAAGSAMARSAEIIEPPQVLWASSAESTQQQLRDRIVTAGQSLGWVVTKDEPGRLELHYDKQGKHQVTIAVEYNAQGYKISYLNSVNLNFEDANGVRKIHPNYNRWIRNLIQRIGTA